ncbi:Phosphotransferase enzyme family protein [Lacunisphaera limnophila]|uniref:Phosphotransferase enzyme family protein n=1 Tax=Lacunisphaera limnophila TaxID=1838286 RepID=A0A1D8AUV8_9BACT|nr:phosphotransferase [Lacunisphaera limnophila]AOS44684.1 Phosphotransferase enzyme family protein [Lacunisphaera limnophila]
MPVPATAPSPGRVVRTLQDGFWDRTEVIELPDGSQRVRKQSKGATAERPWGPESLRREIRYLSTATPEAAAALPTLLAWWDRGEGAGLEVGYEMPFYARHRDAGTLARSRSLGQEEIDVFQGELADAVFARLHATGGRDAVPLSQHMTGAVRQSFDGLVGDPLFAALIEADQIELNGRIMRGPRAVFERIAGEKTLLDLMDRTPAVRLHGDLHLENILWRPLAETGDEPRLVLIDVVSVAGVTFGPPLWDLVKYESYATGELMALRAEQIEVAGFGGGPAGYHCRIRTESAALAPFLDRNWHALVRAAFISQYGRVDERLYRFIHGYFNATMALNTSGLQRQGRLLRATEDFNAVLAS